MNGEIRMKGGDKLLQAGTIYPPSEKDGQVLRTSILITQLELPRQGDFATFYWWPRLGEPLQHNEALGDVRDHRVQFRVERGDGGYFAEVAVIRDGNVTPLPKIALGTALAMPRNLTVVVENDGVLIDGLDPQEAGGRVDLNRVHKGGFAIQPTVAWQFGVSAAGKGAALRGMVTYQVAAGVNIAPADWKSGQIPGSDLARMTNLVVQTPGAQVRSGGGKCL